MKDTEEPGIINRRKLLGLGTSALAGMLAGACNSNGPRSAQKLLRFAMLQNERLERRIFNVRSLDRAPRNVRGAASAFPTYFVSDEMPMWDEAQRGVWTLEVTGAVHRPLRLTLPDLVKLPSWTQRVNHYCVEGWSAVARWTGVRVSELARLAGMTGDAQYADFWSFDSDYHESWDLDSALHPQTLIAYAVDGRYLNANRGAPARLHSPIKLGYKSVKYLTRIVFSPVKTGGYWSDRGYEWYAGT